MKETDKETLNILIDALTDSDWEQLRLKAEVRRAFQKAEVIRAKRQSAESFAEWILEHGAKPGFDDNMNPRWYTQFDDDYTYYTSEELYRIYTTGEWEISKNDDDPDLSDWEVTINDGLDDL